MAHRAFLCLALCICGLVGVAAPARGAEIIVMSDTPVAEALNRIGALFHQRTNNDVRFVFGLSPAIHKRINEGEAADVVVIQPNFLGDLVHLGKIDAKQYQTVAQVGIGLFTRVDASAPDVSTVVAFKQALLEADMLVFSNVAGGNYFATVLERLGVAEIVKAKVVRSNPSDVIARIVEARGNDIGVISKTLIVADKRLKLIGALPGEYQSYLVYAAAPMRASQAPEVASEFVEFLNSPEARREFAAAGAN